jgi:UDP-3-O-[3-hydroxymyristoyl] glucosamine N-acyltransferase
VGFRLAELAELVGGRVVGDPERTVDAIRALDAAGPADLSFVFEGKRLAEARASRAGALLAAPALAGELAGPLLLADDPRYALALLLARFHPPAPRVPGIHPTAVIGAGCVIDPTATVGPYAVIGEGSAVGAGAQVGALVVLGRCCRVGEGAALHPHAVLYDGTELGPGTIVHAGAVLGADGFGYATHGGAHHKIPQVGSVVLEADVEVGANAAIDRATLGETRVGAGTKIDNLVQIGHNVRVGRHSILCGQAGVAGSARLGDYVVLAGQAGAAGHIELGDRVQVAAKSAALSSQPAGATVAGIPAIELRRWRRQVALLSRLEELSRRLRAIERRLGGGVDDREEGPN